METAEKHYENAITLSKMELYEIAIKEFDKAIIADQRYVQAHYGRGYVYYIMKDKLKAMEDFKRVIELDPGYASAYFMRGTILDDFKRYKESIEEYSKAISLNPNNADFYNNRGITFFEIEEYSKAIVDWQKAIQLNPELTNNLNTLITRAETYLFYSLALKPIKAAEKSKADVTALCNLGIQEKRKGNYDLALKYYRDAEQINSLIPNIYYNKAKILAGLGAFRDAIINLLAYYHINIMNTQFDETFLLQNMATNFFKDNVKIGENQILDVDRIEYICDNLPYARFLIIDLNLSYYAGICYLADNHKIRIANNISLDYIKNIQNGLLGKMDQYDNNLRNDEFEKIIYIIGFLFLFINTDLDQFILFDVFETFFSNKLSINLDIENIEDYIIKLLNHSDDNDEVGETPF
ncbi:MAG TPA: tetratricopeptide repeat protein [Ignavibacteria bacterium]|nr:tetratricopeptide repeat protein [Ignavibacteria bacterium]